MSSIALVLVGALLAQVANGQLFTVSCDPLVVERSDPIVNLEAVSGHVHAIIGGTGFSRAMTPAIAVAAKGTTCDKKADKSNYWQPQLYHRRSNETFEIVQFEGAAVYYLNRACDYLPGRVRCPAGSNATAPPAGLRMIVGNPNLRAFDPNSITATAISHICLRAAGLPSVPQSPSFPSASCDRIRAETFFPSCWDGQNLDSPSHSSHVSFPATGQYNGGVCPSTHPIAILSIFMEFFYNTKPFPDSKFVWAMGDPTGYGLHGDFFNGWDQKVLENSFDTCRGPNGQYDANCSVNLNKGSPQKLTPEIPLSPVENIGLSGPISALPGPNPVTGAPIVPREGALNHLLHKRKM